MSEVLSFLKLRLKGLETKIKDFEERIAEDLKDPDKFTEKSRASLDKALTDLKGIRNLVKDQIKIEQKRLDDLAKKGE